MSKKIEISKKKYKELREKANAFEQLSRYLDDTVNIQGIKCEDQFVKVLFGDNRMCSVSSNGRSGNEIFSDILVAYLSRIYKKEAMDRMLGHAHAAAYVFSKEDEESNQNSSCIKADAHDLTAILSDLIASAQNVIKAIEEDDLAENDDCEGCGCDDCDCGCCDESCSECSNYEYQTENITDYELPINHCFVGYSKEENTIGVDFGNDDFVDVPVEHASRLEVENAIAKAYFIHLKNIGVLAEEVDPASEADDILCVIQESGNFNKNGTLKAKKNESNTDDTKEERNDK